MALHTDIKGAKRLTLFAALLAVSIVLNLAEGMIPVFNVLPGAKLGIANTVTMLVMIWFGPFEALLIGSLRSALVGVLSGRLTMLPYGIFGTILSVLSMWMLKKVLKDKVSMAGLSVVGAFFFNLGQVAVSAWVINNFQMFRYLPVLTLISTICGFVTGIVAESISKKRLVGD
jgi:heptaprenyl diphosphate synthase